MNQHTKNIFIMKLFIIASTILFFCGMMSVQVKAAEEYTSGYWTYTVSNEQATISGYSGNESVVNIPSYLGGYPVTTIKEKVFYDCSSITEVYIPETVTTLGYNVFYGTSITEITIPKSITKCNHAPTTTIGYYTGPFGGAEKLKKVTFEEGMTAIPDDVLNIGSTNSVLTTVVIPDTVQTIGNNAFQYCTALTNVVLSKNLTSIGSYAFYHCESLRSVLFTENEDSQTKVNIGSWAFASCKSLYDVYFSDNVTTIGNNAFDSCVNLSTLILPPKLEQLGYNIFAGSSITEITIPKSVTKCDHVLSNGIGTATGPFGRAEKLQKVIFEEGMTKIPDYVLNIGYTNSILKTVVIPDSVHTIGYQAFQCCTALTSIDIPNTVHTIEDDAFQYCSALTDIVLSDNITTIGRFAFYKCTALENVVIKESDNNEEEVPVSIGQYAFSGCTSLTQVSLSKVGNVGTYAFDGCSGITEVHFGNNVTSIGAYAFRKCTNLQSLTFGDDAMYSQTASSGEKVVTGNSLKSIGDYAFYGCTSLTGTLAFPSSVTSIGANAFYNCSGINKMYFAGNFPTIGANAFYGITSDGFYRDNDTTWTKIHTNRTNTTYQYGGTISWKVWQDFWLIQNNTNYFSSSDLGYYMNQLDYDKLINNLTSPTDIFNICFEINKLVKPLSELTGDDYSLTRKINVDGKYKKFLKWGGSCYGLSALSILINNGILNPSDVYADTDYLYDLSSEYAIDSVINFYHAQQKHSCIVRQIDKNLQMNNKKLIEKLESSVDNGLSLIVYGWYDLSTQNSYAHAVVGYGKEDGSWIKNEETYTHRIIVYDCALPNKEDTYIYYNDNGKWHIPYNNASGITQDFSKDCSDNGYIALISSDSDIINLIDYKTGNLSQNPDILLDENIYMFTKNDKMEVTTDNTAFTFDKLFTQMKKGDDNVHAWMMPNVASDGTGISESVISIPKGQYYEVASETEGLAVEVTNDDVVQWAMTENPGIVRFDLNNEITLNCTELSAYSIGMVSSNPSQSQWEQIEVVGETTEPISFKLTNSGLEVEGDDLTDLQIAITENGTRKTIGLATDKDSVLVSDTEDGELAAKGKNNNENDYSDDLINTETCTHDYQMTIIEESTATHPGLQMNICTLCHKKEKESQKTIPATKDLSDCTIKLVADSFEYEGNPIEPSLELYDGDYLVDSSVYKVAYADNNVIGNQAKIIVNGVNGYTGQTETSFLIIHTRHKWDNGTITQDATYEKEGSCLYHCQYCPETKTELIPRLTPLPDSSANTGNGIITVSVPRITSAKNSSSKKILVKWKKVNRVSGYQIQYASNGKYKKAKTVTIKKATTLSKKLTKLKKGKKYYIRIRSYQSIGGKKYYSVWSSSKKVKVKK